MRARALILLCLFSWSAFGADPRLIPKESAQASPVVEPARAAAVEKTDGITAQWWFWTLVGAVAVGAFTGAAIAVSKPHPRITTQPDGDFR